MQTIPPAPADWQQVLAECFRVQPGPPGDVQNGFEDTDGRRFADVGIAFDTQSFDEAYRREQLLGGASTLAFKEMFRELAEEDVRRLLRIFGAEGRTALQKHREQMFFSERDTIVAHGRACLMSSGMR